MNAEEFTLPSRPERRTLSRREVAEMFGVTPEAVRNVERAALEKLRQHPLMLELAREYNLPVDDEE